MENKKTQKRILEGIVVSDKMSKTRVVEVTRLKKHARYDKYFKVSRRYKAHDEKNGYAIGAKVMIQETRPISKDKRWTIISKAE
ncbi:30S ribosomal protein S17 [Candidatus Jorgensenbacteria bacterium RIFCSPLOWO2_02_FULL_45_12]|uniref:Small ribosomal subunit protein uS17 n=2 Tax=Candidatus Joergenseniibacteriota TaxID=1752739 RepID=A0A1F6BPU6_9BACT|nr:MAG: 30S ribosomal protein S17 [Candidatus Jorgensenbacteria bacterium GW2011_GWA2_45_9]OGG38950.1 MAG: 30S ribosomal protein S17 [Candidatus Jorgensenbacteria bacterium RIFCSPHIGHO2_02_FULL_45_20]OGG42709.1 MAG: 30S ribosomal protein S17 [Candidatus Jorgensenbacteria bacterium RIFCSPLOWO2_02_FULL_45_12]